MENRFLWSFKIDFFEFDLSVEMNFFIRSLPNDYDDTRSLENVIIDGETRPDSEKHV